MLCAYLKPRKYEHFDVMLLIIDIEIILFCGILAFQFYYLVIEINT
jgi:hypothetical protein